MSHFKNQKAKRKPEKAGFAIGEGGLFKESMVSILCRLSGCFSLPRLMDAYPDISVLTNINGVVHRYGIDLGKTTVKVLKEMSARVAKLNIH